MGSEETRPVLLDLFCGAGGAAMGYHRAGFDVVGVDIHPQPRFPFRFIQADALTFPLDGFDAIHASPPCQEYSEMGALNRHRRVHKTYPRLIGDMRARLVATDVPWVIENVEGARAEMMSPVTICGTMLGCSVWRHRLFESNVMLFSPGVCQHRVGDISVRRTKLEYIGLTSGVSYYSPAKGEIRKRNKSCRLADAQVAMGIDWMIQRELGESIPPAYTEWLGRQLLAAL